MTGSMACKLAEMLPFKTNSKPLAAGLEHCQRGRDNFLTDSVAGYYGNTMMIHDRMQPGTPIISTRKGPLCPF